MQLTINLEAPLATGTFDVLAAVQEFLRVFDAKVRIQRTSYWTDKGPRTERTFVVFVPEVPPAVDRSLHDRLGDLAAKFEQDCVAYKTRAYGCTVADLAGPRAGEWLPFNPDYFVEY